MIHAPHAAADPADPAGAPAAPRAGRPSIALTGVLLVAVLAAGAWLRFAGADWDDHHHLHPDERFLTMVGASLDLPQDLLGYLDTDTSPLNPRNTGHAFFSYGTWPVTLTYVVADAAERLRTAPDGSRIQEGWRSWLLPDVEGLTSYSGIHRVGRAMSALLDLLGVLLVFGIAALLYDRRVGLLAAALHAFTAFHIQQAHFFTVDAPLTAFVLLALFGLAMALRLRGRAHWLGLVVAGAGLGMALASKVSVWLLVPVAVAVLGWSAHRSARIGGPPWWTRWALQVALLGIVSLGTLKVTEPTLFAGPGWPNVVADPVRYQQVTSGEWVAPGWWFTARDLMPDALEMYLLPDPRWANSMDKVKAMVTGFGMDWAPNHQWWGRKAYLYPLSNAVRWGMGWPLGIAAVVAWAAAGVALARRDRRHALIWLWVTAFFGFQGLQWIKTLRYFLPVFAPLTILAAWGLIALCDAARDGWRLPRPSRLASRWPGTRGRSRALSAAIAPELARPLALGLVAAVVAGTALWGIAVHRIYRRDHPRVAASEWIYHNLETAFGLRLTSVDEALRDDIRGPWLPALPAGELPFQGNRWTMEEDGIWRGPMRVLVPGPPLAEGEEAPTVTADAVRVAFVVDPAGDAAPEGLELALSSKAFLDASGAPEAPVAGGTGDLIADEAGHAIVALERPVALASGGEYYLWLRARGAPIAGRPAVLAHETPWDDAIPLGLAGYAARDDPATDWAEGLFGVENFEMYGEDFPGWLDETFDGLSRTDYWISTSNRVYGAVAQLPMRYPATLGFYGDALFGEGFGFRHVLSEHSYPGLGPWEVPDQHVEEAIHVYDHPRVDVFAVPASRDFAALRAHLEALAATRRWRGFPPVGASAGQRLIDALLGRIPVERAGAPSVEAAGDPRDARDPIALDPGLAAAQRAGGTWTALFDDDGFLARHPVAAAVWWYLVLGLLGVLAFPLVGAALPNLADRGWSVARVAGLLVVAWLGWWTASLRLAPHTTPLLLACVGALTAASALAAWASRFDAIGWVRSNARRVLWLEGVMLGLYVVFLAVKAVNPDLWHSHYGGEKPMDLAYLMAVLRSTYFPPYDPWFAGGRMNYYYFGFVVFGSLVELTRVVPWIAYNLIVATIAALTGTAAFGLVVSWLAGAGHGERAERAGLVAAFVAVLSGNLFQVPFVLGRLAEIAPTGIASHLPGVSFASRVVGGALAVARGDAVLPVPYGHHWYWNASRAIPSVPGDTQPITEFPFFTFLYGDLHAHMMAMPIALLAFAVALAWALPAAAEEEGWRSQLRRGAALTALGALAVGALWPTNAWDYPSFGLILGGAIVLAAWRGARSEPVEREGADTEEPGDALETGSGPLRGPSKARAVLRILLPASGWGLALLGGSLLLFLPFHATYVAPYGAFAAWRGYRTPPGSYLIIHGLALAPIVSWACVRIARHARSAGATAAARWLAPFVLGATALAIAGALWARVATSSGEFPAPSPITPALVALLVGLGAALLLLPGATWPDRLAGGTLLVGALLTGLVENVVLAGDIGRMNTVFKFYIHVWLIWAVTAGYCAGRVLDALRGRGGWATAWRVAFGLLLATGLLYTVTATRAKAQDRFEIRSEPDDPTSGPRPRPEPGLDGAAFLEWAVYDDVVPLRLAYDAEAFRWLRDHTEGTPTVLEAFRPHYRWGARYSIWTGLPAVLGWDWHQKQQRNGGQAWLVDDRARDVEALYNTTDDAEARALLDRYEVEIVVVGELEHALYDPAGLAKFERWAEEGSAERLFRNDGVALYRVDAAANGAAGDGAPSGSP